jgi:acetolactate synthase regulatory subunit
MARREPIVPLKLAFFVEGDRDKDFVETLVPRVVGPSALVRVVRVGGKAAFSSTFSEAAQFLEAGYASVFLVVDADTEIPTEIDLQKQRLADVFRRYGLEDRVRICMAVPMFEAWLLAAFRDDPEGSTHPKRDLARFVGTDADDKIRSLVADLPIEVARRRSKSFDEFVTNLETFAPSKARRAS